MDLFVDTSALVKLYYPEEDSLRFEETILAAGRIYVSELSPVELASVLMKKVRAGDLEQGDKSIIWDTFLGDMQAGNVETIGFSSDDYLKASELILKHAKQANLRTLDSLQLTAALKVPDALFLAADRHLTRAAELAGLRLAQS